MSSRPLPNQFACSGESQYHGPVTKGRLNHSASTIDDELDVIILTGLELRPVLYETSNRELSISLVNSGDRDNARQSRQADLTSRAGVTRQDAAGDDT